MKLKDLATIQMGYAFRSRLEGVADGQVAVIQMKDLLDDNTVCCSDLLRIDMDGVKDHHLVRIDDLVFRSRGLQSTSAILGENPGQAVLAAPLLRIRVTALDKLLPAYLNWYIAQRDAQQFFDSRAEGTVQRMISKRVLEQLEVVFPSLERQQAIVEWVDLAARERELMLRLADRRQQYMAQKFVDFAKGER